MGIFDKKVRKDEVKAVNSVKEGPKANEKAAEPTRYIASEALMCELLLELNTKLGRIQELLEVPKPEPIDNSEQLALIIEQLEFLNAEVKNEKEA